jgi:pyruvate/2-oxoglutarate dehydrogenase complex dihydrolipoamide dehydrogenase (E3) component
MSSVERRDVGGTRRAAGDVTGRMPFTHAAFAMGRLAAGNALTRRRRRRYDPATTPCVTFTDPEVARVGLTEAQAATRGGRVAWLPMADMDRAIAANATDEFIKLRAGPRPLLRNLGGGRILGAAIVAAAPVAAARVHPHIPGDAC